MRIDSGIGCTSTVIIRHWFPDDPAVHQVFLHFVGCIVSPCLIAPMDMNFREGGLKPYLLFFQYFLDAIVSFTFLHYFCCVVVVERNGMALHLYLLLPSQFQNSLFNRELKEINDDGSWRANLDSAWVARLCVRVRFGDLCQVQVPSWGARPRTERLSCHPPCPPYIQMLFLRDLDSMSVSFSCISRFFRSIFSSAEFTSIDHVSSCSMRYSASVSLPCCFWISLLFVESFSSIYC